MAKPLSAQLCQAVKDNNTEAVTKLIKQGAYINEPWAEGPSDSGITPLGIAAIRKRVDCARILIEAGADVNVGEVPPKKPKPNFGYNELPPLHLAAQTGSPEIVQLLIDHGADVKRLDSRNTNAMLTAIFSCDGKSHIEVIKLLAKAGLNPSKVRKGELSCLVVAAGRSGVQYRKGLITTLVQCGADPNAACPRTGALPLHEAVREGCLKNITELLECGADPRLAAPKSKNQDWSELSPLDYANTIKAKKSVVDLLSSGLKKTPDVDRKKAAKSKPVKASRAKAVKATKKR